MSTFNTATQTTLEQLVTECSQNPHVLAIATYTETPRVLRLVCYVQETDLAPVPAPLRYIEGTLIQVEQHSLGAEDAAAATPAGALRLIPSWRDAEIRYDPQGLLTARKAQAEGFQWGEGLQQRANHDTSQRLYDLVPLLQCLIHGVEQDDWSLLSLEAGEIGRALGDLVLVQRGQLIASEGEMYRALQSAIGESSTWWREFAQAVGLRLPSGWISLARMRGLAALSLYLETLKLFADILEDSHRSVIETTAQQIEETVGAFRK